MLFSLLVFCVTFLFVQHFELHWIGFKRCLRIKVWLIDFYFIFLIDKNADSKSWYSGSTTLELSESHFFSLYRIISLPFFIGHIQKLWKAGTEARFRRYVFWKFTRILLHLIHLFQYQYLFSKQDDFTSSTHIPESSSGPHKIMVLSIEAESSFRGCSTESPVGGDIKLQNRGRLDKYK